MRQSLATLILFAVAATAVADDKSPAVVVDKEKRKSILLNFADVDFLSSAALNKLIVLDKKVKTSGGKLQLCNLKPEIFEIFAITRLTQLFAIKRTEQEALAAF